MRIEVYDEESATKEQVLRLALRKNDGGVSLVAVDDKGAVAPCGYLFSFQPDGLVHRHGFVSRSLGLRLNGNGQIDC